MKINFLIITIVSVSMAFQAKAQSITNPDTVCAGSNVYYKIPNPTANSTFTWGIYNSQGTITYGAGTDSIHIDWNNTAGIDSLWVYETNLTSCNGDTAKLKVVRVLPPTAGFDNSSLCYGENLNINFTGNPPYNVKYTLDGNIVTQSGIAQNTFLVEGASGNYVLVQVSNKYCETGSINGTINAIISQQFQELQIFHD